MRRQALIRLGLSLALNILLCCILLPFIIPPFPGFSLSALFEVLLWQVIGAVGWPLALMGLAISVPFGARTSAATLLPLFIYPVIEFLLIRLLISKTPRRIDFILLHIFVILSFIVMWSAVLNGFNFMPG